MKYNLRHIPETSIAGAILDNRHPIIYVCACNFEERSVHGLRIILRHLGIAGSLRSAIVCQVRSDNLPTVLSNLSVSNRLKMEDLLKVGPFTGAFVTVDYSAVPPNTEELVRELRRAPLGSRICVDCSCFPRRVLWAILDEALKRRFELFVLYVSAKRYPASRVSSAGELVGILSNETLEMVKASIRDQSQAYAMCVVPSVRSGEALRCWRALCKGAGMKHILAYIPRHNVRLGMTLLRTNWPLWKDPSTIDGECIVYFPTLPQGVRALRDVCDRAARAKLPVLFAPLGPKPLGLAAMLFAKELRHTDGCSDVFPVSTVEADGVYSLGYVDEPTLFKIDIEQ